MHLHWERSTNTTGDCHINNLSWMGRVPEEIPEVGLQSSVYLSKQFVSISINFFLLL